MAGNAPTPAGSTTGGATPSPAQVIQELMTRISQLEAQIHPAGGTRLKVNKPTPFTGERKKLRSFLAQMNLYFSANSSNIAVEADKVLAAATFLEGEALAWFEPYLRAWFEETEDERDDEITETFQAYSNFTDKLKSTFGEVDEKNHAMMQLTRLRQTTSASEYCTKHQQISSHLDWNDEALADSVYQGLKDEVKDEIAKIPKRPDSYLKMIEIAVRIDNRLYERRMERRHRGTTWRPPTHHQQRRANQGARRHDPYGPMPMELDATAEYKKYDKKKVRFDKATIECYNCHKKGHYAKECKSPKQERQIKATYDNGFNEEDQERYAEWDHEYGISDYRDEDCNSFSGTESEMNLHMETMHAHELYGQEDQGATSKPKTEDNEDLESQLQDAQERQLPEEITTDDEWENIESTPGFKCGPECQELHDNPKHPGHGSTAWAFCTEDWCSVHLDAKQGSGYFPRVKGKKPRNCKWLEEAGKTSQKDPQRDVDAAVPKEAKQQTEAGSARSAQTSEKPKRRTRALVTFEEGDPKNEMNDEKRPTNTRAGEMLKELISAWNTPDEETIRRNSVREVLKEIDDELRRWDSEEIKATAHGRHFKIEADILGSKVQIMIDSGATGNFMDPKIKEGLQILGRKKPTSVPLTGLNGEKLSEEGITEETGWLPMIIDKHFEMINFDVAKLGRDDVILGIPWLRKHNPEIHWDRGQLQLTRCNCETTRTIKASATKEDLEVIIKETIDTPLQDETKGKIVTGVTEEVTLQDDYNLIEKLLATEAAKHQLKSSTDVVLPKEYEQFRDLFDGTYKALPDHSEWDHTIPLKEGKEPVPQKIYPVSGNEEEALKKYIKENLEKGYIRPSTSPAGYPVLFVKKKGTTDLRMCVDFRQLNNITIRDSYPLPLITEIQDKIRGKKWFTKLDITDAYNRLRIKKGEEWKTAFKTKFGHYEYTVMPFGLTNAPAAFQRYIDNVMSPYLHDFTIAYLDDILIFSNSMEEHVQQVKKVLKKLREAKLQVKLKKCEFHVQETDFLGHRITQEGIQTEKEKVQAIQDWPAPKNLKELQSFIGLLNYYRRYIEGYAKIMEPMFRLLKKDKPYEWGNEQEKAFKEAKHKMTTAPILAQHDPELPTTMETDASDFAIGATMTQPGKDGKPRPIAYYSRKLIDAELNYEIHDKELLAIVNALRHWRVYLEGTKYPIRIITDHKNLTYFTTTKILTRRQARWSELLGNYWFTIEHCKGKENERADALSRRPDHEEGIKKPEPALLKLNKEGHLEYNPQIAVLAATMETTTDSELQDKIVEETLKDDLIQSLIKNEDDKVTATETGLVFWYGLIYVPRPVRNEIIRLHHDTLISGHPGQTNTMERITRSYYWPRMMKDIEKYIEECDACQKNKIKRHKPYGLMQTIKAPEYPFQWVTMDHITKLPRSEGLDSILVVVDRMTKYACFIATTEQTDAEGLAWELMNEVFKYHGIPEIIISDRGVTFASKLWKSMMDLMGGEQRLSTAYHPQTNGQTERTNQTLEQYLRHYVNDHQDNWADLLPMAQLAYNTSKHSTTEVTPFFAVHGREARLPGQPRFEQPVNPVAEQKVQEMNALYFYLQTEIINQNKLNIGYYNEKHLKGPELKRGGKVYLSRKNIETTRPSNKLDHLRIGPFEIEEKISEVNYRLKLPSTTKVHPVFHISLLEPAPQNAKTQEETLIEQNAYEVEAILGEKKNHKEFLYLVKWKGKSETENTWETIENLRGAQEALEEYRRRNPILQSEKVADWRVDLQRRNRK